MPTAIRHIQQLIERTKSQKRCIEKKNISKTCYSVHNFIIDTRTKISHHQVPYTQFKINFISSLNLPSGTSLLIA